MQERIRRQAHGILTGTERDSARGGQLRARCPVFQILRHDPTVAERFLPDVPPVKCCAMSGLFG